jgi:hypothetical protein
MRALRRFLQIQIQRGFGKGYGLQGNLFVNLLEDERGKATYEE